MMDRTWLGLAALLAVWRRVRGSRSKYLSSAQFQAQTVADYKFKGELIRKLGLLSQ